MNSLQRISFRGLSKISQAALLLGLVLAAPPCLAQNLLVGSGLQINGFRVANLPIPANALNAGVTYQVLDSTDGSCQNGGGTIGVNTPIWCRSNGTLYQLVGGGSSGTATWGTIIGTLSNQTDLQNALNLKAALASPTFTGTFTLAGITGSTQCLHVNSAGILTGTGSDCGAGGSVAWGGITGTLSSQTDLQNALNLKSPIASPTFTGILTTPALTLSAITGSAQCLHVNSSGVVSGVGADCAAGGTVTNAASLTSTAFMAGAGGNAAATPSATSTLDGSGNAGFAGTVASGVGGSLAGGSLDACNTQTIPGTPANATGIIAPASCTGQHLVQMPATGATGASQVLTSTGAESGGKTATQWAAGGGGGIATVEYTGSLIKDAFGNFNASYCDTEGLGGSAVPSVIDGTANWEVPNTGSPNIVCTFQVPTSATGRVDSRLVWFQNSGGSGNVGWTVNTCVVVAGANITCTYNAGQSPTPQATLASGLTVYTTQASLNPPTSVVAGASTIKVKWTRGAGDTYANSIRLISATITFY